MPITDYLELNSLHYGDEIALVEINPEQAETRHITWKDYELMEPTRSPYYRREVTWSVFNEKANRFANTLLSHGIGKGKKVGILLMNCLEWLPIYFGTLKSGAVAVPMNFRFSSQEIEYCVKLSEVDILVFGTEFIGRVEEIADAISKDRTLIYMGQGMCPSFADSYTELTANASSQNPNIPLTDSEDAAIYFSSGTTGFPKAILHNHESLMHAAKTEQAHHHQTHDDVFLCIPPLYHTGAKMHWFGSLVVGGKAVLLKGVKPQWIFETISREKCTIVWLLVPWAQDILACLDRGELNKDDFQLEQLRLMHIGAQPVPRSLIKRWLEYFPHHQYDTNYGLSESIGPGCVHLGMENVHKVGAIGIAGYGWQTRIVNEQLQDVARGEIGELCVKGPGVMTCYFNDPAATAATLKDGWLLTGDMAREDEDGFIFLVDRKKDVIITGGENLYPVQIEDFLSAHPAIQDVAVIGLPDKRLGEIAAAVIQLKPGARCTQADIDAFCQKLPRYKRPRRVIFADVTRNATGKIDKKVMRKVYGSDQLVAEQNNG